MSSEYTVNQEQPGSGKRTNSIPHKPKESLVDPSASNKSTSVFLSPDDQNLHHWDRPDSSWNNAAQSTLQGDPFCCGTQWQLSYHEAFNPDRKLYIRESSGSIIALAQAPSNMRPGLFTPVEAHWFFGCPLMGADAVELLDEAIEDISRHTLYTQPKASFVISGIRPRGKLYRQLLKQYGNRFEFRKLISDTQCSASLTGGLDGFLSRRSGNHRRNLTKQSHRAQRKGVYFERYQPLNDRDVDDIYPRIIAVEEASWKGINQCGMAEQPAKRYYHRMLKRLAVSGHARVIMARQGDRDIGFMFGGIAADIYRGQQFSFAEDWAKLSIGNLLQLEQIDWLCEEGVKRYDMGPLMGYKHHWREKRFNIETWFLEPKSGNAAMSDISDKGGKTKAKETEPGSAWWKSEQMIQNQRKLNEFVNALNSPEGLSDEQKAWWWHRY